MEEELILSLGDLKARTQALFSRKDSYIKNAISNVLSSEDVENPFKIVLAYRDIVNKNSELLDLLRDTRDEVLFLKRIKERLDGTTELASAQARQLENLIKLLGELEKIISPERDKLDRMIRFYERASNGFANF